MSLVDVFAVRAREDVFELSAFGDGHVAHRESYALVVLEPCEGCEPMLTPVNQRLVRLACESGKVFWRDADGACTWSVEAESHMLDPETGELFTRLDDFNVQVGDLLYVVERESVLGRLRRRLLGRVRYVSVFA